MQLPLDWHISYLNIQNTRIIVTCCVSQVVDLLVLFILHSTNANHSRRGAERVLKVKVRKGLIQENLLQKTFKGHAQVRFHSHAYD